MRCPILKDLPPPPKGKTGWPWTEESRQLPDIMPNGCPWPKISVVTPNYNFGDFVEETIRSVLLQGYPDLEYIIIDGGSTDNSLEIIKKYERWFIYWETGSDQGQSFAINKGFEKVTGDIINWINSDDYLLPDAFEKLAKSYNPNLKLIIGDTIVKGNTDSRKFLKRYRIPSEYYDRLLLPQPSSFFCNLKLKVDEKLNFCMDWALYQEILKKCAQHQVIEINSNLAVAFLHPESKTYKGMLPFFEEMIICYKKWLREEKIINKKIISLIRLLQFQARIAIIKLYRFDNGIRGLVKLAVFNPMVLFDRMFWGACHQQIHRKMR